MSYVYDLIWWERASVPYLSPTGEAIAADIICARPVLCDSLPEAHSKRAWHLAHPEQWQPACTIRGVDGQEPEVTEIRKTHR